jgi:hypothetical protein
LQIKIHQLGAQYLMIQMGDLDPYIRKNLQLPDGQFINAKVCCMWEIECKEYKGIHCRLRRSRARAWQKLWSNLEDSGALYTRSESLYMSRNLIIPTQATYGLLQVGDRMRGV